MANTARCWKAPACGLPAHATHIVEIPGRPGRPFISPGNSVAEERLCHRKIHRLDDAGCLVLIETVAAQIAEVWAFNAKTAPERELAIDGQLSNWVDVGSDGHAPQLVYIVTSTSLLRNMASSSRTPSAC